MPYTISYLEEKNIIETIYEGKVRVIDVITVIQKNVGLARRYQTGLFLVDCALLIDEKEHIFENYDVGTFMTKVLDQLPRSMRDAIILPENEIGKANLRFFERVARNRGVNVQTFEKREDAFAWLLQG